MKKPKISIITVVFNDAKHIEDTIKSVLDQSFTDKEYVIIDGKSTDGTLEIIKKYTDKIDKLVSEPDKGIYDAMNKGIKLASGEYILFLNSGDLFYNEKTLENIFNCCPNCDIYYGDAVIRDEKGNILGFRRHRPPEQLNWKSFVKGMLVSHQAFIPKKQIVDFYDLKYRVASDIDWCVKAMKKAKKICNTKQIIVKFLKGGMSAKKRKQALKERFLIMKKYYGLLPTLKTYFINSLKSLIFYIKHKRMM